MLTSVQYDYQDKIAQVTQANLTEAGFNIDLQVTDWATILQRRQNPDQWDAFVTGHGVVPEPSSITVFNPSYPGWWDTPDKRVALEAFVTESEPGQARATVVGPASAVLRRGAHCQAWRRGTRPTAPVGRSAAITPGDLALFPEHQPEFLKPGYGTCCVE